MFNQGYRFLLIPLGAICAIVALSGQPASRATTPTPVVSQLSSDEVVTCTDANRKIVDICIIADSVSH